MPFLIPIVNRNSAGQPIWAKQVYIPPMHDLESRWHFNGSSDEGTDILQCTVWYDQLNCILSRRVYKWSKGP